MEESQLIRVIKNLNDDIVEINERLRAIEVEQRKIREDILSGEPKERMHKRILDNQDDNLQKIREKIDEEIKIKI